MVRRSIIVPLDYISCHLFSCGGTSNTLGSTSTSTEVSALHLGAQGRFVLPVAVRGVDNLSKGAALVARAEGEGRIVIETREAITKGVWANAPTPTGLNTITDVRAMRNEDNEISQTNHTRRSKVTSADAAGALLLKRLGR